MLKKITCALLALLMLVSLVACSSDEETTDTDTDVVSTEAENAETDINPNLAAIDGKGKEIRILTRESALVANYWYEETDHSESDMSNVVDAAVYKRNRIIEDKYNVKLVSTAINYNDIDDTITNQVASMTDDADSYHIALPMLVHAFGIANNGYCYSVDKLPLVNPEKDYWFGDIYNATTIGGRNYFISGDINTSVYGSSWTVYFNEAIVANNGIEDPYAIVKRGAWTIDKMLELSKNFGGDGGDGVYDNTDNYAICSGTWVWQCFMYGADLKFVEKDNSDTPYVVTSDTTKSAALQSILTRTVEIMNDPSLSVNAHAAGLTAQPSVLFCNSQVLFYLANINNAFVDGDIKDMTDDYGVLPLPKLNDEQEYYSNAVHPHHSSTVMVPKNISGDSLELISSILEDMSYNSYLHVKPAYYDTVITYRSVRNENSYEMMPYIFERFNIDFGLVMTDTFGFDNEIRSRILNNDKNFASYFKTYSGLWQKTLNNIISNYGNA